MSSIRNLICKLDDFQLNIHNMELKDEGINILTGPSGSGKSTLALALCGLIKTKSPFQWFFNEKNLALLPPPERNISMMFQSLELFPHLTAKKNILFPSQSRKQSILKTKERFQLLTKELELTPFLKKSVLDLSGGEKQRVALARALIVTSDFLILDEPFSSLDIALKNRALKLLCTILKQEKQTCLLITHEDPEVMKKGDKIFAINQGKLKHD